MTRLGPLAERDFRLLFLARSISMLGSAMAPIALAFAVLDDLGGTPTDLGLVLAASWLPQIAITLFAGVWADRLPRNLVLVASDLLLFAVQAAVAALLLLHAAELWQLVVLGVLRGAAQALFLPAVTGVVPQVVAPERLQQANSLVRLTQSASNVVGAAAAGVVVAGLGSGVAIAFDAVTFLVSALLLVRIRLPAPVREAGSSLLRELREGWREFSSRTWLWAIVLAAMVGNFSSAIGVQVLGPVVAKDSLGGAVAWGVITSAFTVGLVVGGLVMLRWRPARPLLVGCTALALWTPPFFLLAVAAPVPAICGAGVLAGIGLEVFEVNWVTTMQQQIPEDRISRVSSYDALGSFLAIPLGLTLAGPLSAAIGVEATILAAGALVLASTAPLFAIRDVRRLRRAA